MQNGSEILNERTNLQVDDTSSDPTIMMVYLNSSFCNSNWL